MNTPDEFAKELAKQLPLKDIYTDAAAPAAKQTGRLLEDLVEVLAACTCASSVGCGTSGPVSRLRGPFHTPCAGRPTDFACDTNRRASVRSNQI